MSVMPLVSVVIPAYNHEKYVREAIEAVINQDYENIELILIDDGSPDKTWDIVSSLKERCEKRFKRVVFEHQENRGTCHTFNRLFDLAQGEYVAISASDDKFLPKAITLLSAYLTQHSDVGLVVGKNLIMDSDSRICYWDKFCNNVYQEAKAYYKTFSEQIEKTTKITANSDKYGKYETLVNGNHIANGWMFRRSLWKEVLHFTPEAPLEDWWFMLQISKFAEIKAIQEETFCYRWHGANTVKQTEKMRKMTHRTVIYEEKCVKDNPRWEKIFTAARYRTRMLFCLGGLIKFYKKTDLYRKQKILQICGHQFILKSKKLF